MTVIQFMRDELAIAAGRRRCMAVTGQAMFACFLAFILISVTVAVTPDPRETSQIARSQETAR